MSFALYLPDSLIGHEIAGYEITDFIDSGAASLVFRGKRAAEAPAVPDTAGAPPGPAPDVAAIKVLAPSLRAPAKNLTDFQRRFQREADALKRLTHPHILTVIASGKDTDAGYCYMALPYMEGGSLARDLSAHGPRSLTDVEAMLTRLADALDYAHAQGVVHRDVKPGNILLDAHGVPYLGDFGIMRLLSDTTTQQTTIGRVIGSPAYMAPEQFREPNKVGPLSDVYSLGMVVYQMVTGRVAFEATTWSALIHQQLYEMPPMPRRARPDLPEPAAAAILKALEKDNAQRFPSAAAFAQAFALGLRDTWADGLMEYMASATVTAVTIAAPTTPAETPVVSDLATPSTALTWPNEVAAGSQANGIWRHNYTLGVATLLLLVSFLAGALYLGATGSAVPPQTAQSTSHAVASAKATQTPTPVAPTPTRTPPPRPTATKAPSGDGGGKDTPGKAQQSSQESSHGNSRHKKHHD